MPFKLHIIICSTRPGRVGPSVARWFHEFAIEHGAFEASSPPAFVNALNYGYKEWNYKPCGFVSYGGVSGGLRAVQMEKLLVAMLKMMLMVEGVTVPRVARQLDADGNFISNEPIEASAKTLLDELLRWTGAQGDARARLVGSPLRTAVTRGIASKTSYGSKPSD